MLRSVGGLKKTAIVSIISILIIIADFITKKIIVSKVVLYDSISVLPFLNIVHIENKGAAFGILSSLGNQYFIIVAIIAIIFIMIYLAKSPLGLETYALSLVLGGAAGNFIDRVRIGKVIDFIDVFVNDWHWPAFNIADSALTVGITLFIIASFRTEKRVKTK